MTSAYPLQWPEGWKRTPSHQRRYTSAFKTTFVKARGELFAELDRLGATGAIVSSWLPLRNDGMPRADAARMRIEDPGVAVYFTLRKRPMVMARDAFETVHDNLRSIGLAVSHLRGLDRHGGAVMMERAFEGFAQLPSPERADWRARFGIKPGDAVTEETIRQRYRSLARDLHPDVGGSDRAMAELNAARDQALREIAT